MMIPVRRASDILSKHARHSLVTILLPALQSLQ